MSDIVKRARNYLAENAAESGADVLIDELATEVTRLRSLTTWRPIDDKAKNGDEILAISETGNTEIMLCRWIALIDFITDREAEELAEQGMDENSLENPDWFVADFSHPQRLSQDCYPTVYLPLPPPPETKTPERGTP